MGYTLAKEIPVMFVRGRERSKKNLEERINAIIGPRF